MMEITVKATPEHVQDAPRAIRDAVREVVDGVAARVERVFPQASTGNRSRMFILNLPDELSSDQVRRLIDRLERQDAVEYASLPEPRRAI
jgi:hypothetical protein